MTPAAVRDWREGLDRRMVVPFVSTSVDDARKLLQRLLEDAPIHRTCRENAVVVFHELAMNAVDHGEPGPGTLELGWYVEGDCLVLTVLDHGCGGQVAARPISLDEPRGRGLLMVDAFSERWQVDRDERTRVTAWVGLHAS